MIRIDKKPFSETMFYSGTYTADSSLNEDEYQENRYDFTLIHIVGDNSEDEVSITWLDDVFITKEVEQSIITKFLKLKLK